MKKVLLSRWTKALLFLVCLIPAARLVWSVFGGLIPPPLETVQRTSGDWTIWFLGITLSITPLRALLNQPLLVRYRRMFGLFTFFYGSMHFMVWLWLDKDFDLHEMWKDVFKRPYITVGFAALMLMVPLAITSTAGWVRRLGYRRWQLLHRLVYATAILGVIHYYWGVKSDVRLPVLYGAILAGLLAYRLIVRLRRVKPAAFPAPQKPIGRTAEP